MAGNISTVYATEAMRDATIEIEIRYTLRWWFGFSLIRLGMWVLRGHAKAVADLDPPTNTPFEKP